MEWPVGSKLHQQDDMAAFVYDKMPWHYSLCTFDVCLRQCCGLPDLHVMMLMAGRTVLFTHAVHSLLGHLICCMCSDV